LLLKFHIEIFHKTRVPRNIIEEKDALSKKKCNNGLQIGQRNDENTKTALFMLYSGVEHQVK
jgi:hypothetical protein